MAETLENFLREKKRKNDQLKQAVDWETRKTWWLDKINHLYDEVKEWLAPLVPEVISIKEDTMEVYEEHLGSYEAPYLKINLYTEVVKLIPIGTIIIGGLGRVDLIGDEGSVMIVLEQKGHRPQVRVYIGEEEISKSKKQPKPPDYNQMDTEWIIPTEKGRPRKYQVLNREVFNNALMRVITK